MKKPLEGRTKRLIALGAAAVILAVLFELIFVALSNRTDSAEYRRTELSAADFESWEFESRGGDEYYALAYNSYFFAENLSLGPVKNIEVYFSRSQGDLTETVIYYTGTVNGIYGDFSAPLVAGDEGVYTAYIDAEQIDSVRIYPTETVRSTVSFSGAVFSPEVISVTFSPSRLLLWVVTLAMIYSMYILVRHFCFKKGERPKLWLSLYSVANGLALLALFVATRTFSTLRGTESFILPLGFIAITAAFAALWFIVVRLKKPHEKLAAIVAVAGTIFVFALAPLQAPDEQNHYLRAFALSRGQLNFEYNYDYPDDVEQLCYRFSGQVRYNILEPGKATIYDLFSQYLAGGEAPDVHCNIQIILPYIPASVGMALVSLVGGGALACLYAGRLMNLAVFVLCAYFALKLAKRYRGAVILTTLFPLTVFMASSLSYDSMFLSAFILLLGLLFKEDFTSRDMWLAAAMFCVIILIKPIYFPLALLLLTVPKESYKAKTKKPLALILFVGFGVLVYLGSLIYAGLFAVNIPPTTYLEGVDKLSQIKYVLSNPLRYAIVMVADGYANSFYLNALGVLGALDAPCLLTNLLAPVAIVFVSALYADTASIYKKSDTLIHGIVVAVSYAVIVTGFYAMWSTLGSSSILGVQARYFITLVPSLAALISRALSKTFVFAGNDRKNRDNTCLAVCGSLAALASLELFANYFLM